MELLGKTVRKEFEGFGIFSGVVKSYDSSTGFFEIVYEDGDSEEMEYSEIASLLEGIVGDQDAPPELMKKPSRAGRKPKKRRRFEIHGDSGNDSSYLLSNSCFNQSADEIQRTDGACPEVFAKTLEEPLGVGENCNDTVSMSRNVDINATCDRVDPNQMLNLNDGVNPNHGLDLNVGLNLNGGVNLNGNGNLDRSNSIDLNFDLNDEGNGNSKVDDLGGTVVDTRKIDNRFDLNLGLDDETKSPYSDCDGQLKKTTSSGMAEGAQSRENCGNVEGMQMKGGSVDKISKGVHSEIVEGTLVKGSSGSIENLLGDVIQKEDAETPRSLKRNATFEALDVNFINDSCSSEIQSKGLSNAGTMAIDEYQGNSGSTHRGRNNRKRIKLSDSANSRTEAGLRRSTRRGRTAFSAQNHIGFDAVNDELLSPAVSAISEEKLTVSGLEESEEPNILPPKLQLPPSSKNLNLDGIPILDLFSVYAFLRSFSTLLFLSPFELEDFVSALKCKAPNLLIDCIHVSLLQTLRKHLEFLSEESSQSASRCLRCLNWDLLDLITWPIFMVQYLLMHSSGLKPGFDLCHLKLFESDYYKQPASVKIEILRCLCDDAIEVEAIRSELNRRMLGSEPNMDFDRNMKLEVSKKRRDVMDVSSVPCLTEEVVDDTTDWNSDECYLCKMDGNLICCDGCPAAFHSRCVGVASSLLPEGDWYCPECVIDKDKPWLKVGKSIRGAELLGSDPYGRFYYSSCGYLLVSDSCGTESLFNYYHRNDLAVVIEALKSSDILYSTILSSITKLWNVTTIVNGAKSDMDSQNVTVCLDFSVEKQMPTTPMLPLLLAENCVKDETTNEGKAEEKSMITTYSGNIGFEVSEFINIRPVNVNHSIKMANPLASSEGSAEISQDIRMDCLNRSAGILNDSEIPGNSVSVGDYSLTSINLKVEQGKKTQSAALGCKLSTVSTRVDASQGLCGNSYVNYYSFARTASSIAEELTRKPSDKISVNSKRSVEEMLSAQLKAISNISTEFCWSNIQNRNVDAWKENCGWCFSCKAPDDDNDCLFIVTDTGPVLKNFTSELLGIRSRKNRKGHLIDVMCHIFCIEDRLHGLLLGPWLNPHYSKLWRKSSIRTPDVTSVKYLLLMLESNLRHLALSSEWIKHVDIVATMGSASHVVTKSLRVSSKHGHGRKRARYLDLEPNSSSNAASGLGLFWWRGGRLSRQLFNCMVLPRSLASKAARQAGCKKIPGMLYPDSSEFAKRSKYVAWRASVETSRSVQQLALQVRELDANIRWGDIENTNLFSKMNKESRKSVMSFKKAIVRRKCLEGTVVKYLLDFGKRRFIPDIVARHGFMLQESSTIRKKYWLEESYVPLYLLKVFEERRIARKSSKTSSGKLHERGTAMKKPSKKKGFSYLFSKPERSENYQCGHCKKDVLIREAVSCQYCEGYFHKRHVRKSAGALTAECIYTCHKCQDVKCIKVDTKRGKSQLQKSKKASKILVKIDTKKGKSLLQKSKKASNILRPVHAKITGKSGKEKQPAQSQNNGKDSVVVPLRRSTRKVKCLSLESKKIGELKEKKQTKSRKGTSKKPKKCSWKKKRTLVYHNYWLNGLLLSRKPNDERAMHFRSEKLLASSEQLTAILEQPKCSLCSEPEFTSALIYISCEICGEWFHGDAFGLGAENVGHLIGFKCHKCRNRTPPVCPHLRDMRSDEALLDGSKNGAGIECAEEVSNGLSIPNEVVVKQKLCSDEESKNLFLIDESSHVEQRADTVPDSSGTLALDAECGHLPVNLEQRTEAIHNCKERDWSPPDILMESVENTSLEDN